MRPVKQLIDQILGTEAKEFSFKLSRKTHHGWRRDFEDDGRADAGKLVTKWWRRAHEAGLQLFVGASQFMIGPGQYSDSWGEVAYDPADGPPQIPDPDDAPPSVLPVYALPGLDAMQVVQFADVGSHNSIMYEIHAELNKQPPNIDATQFIKDYIAGRYKPTDRRKPWQRIQAGLRKIMTCSPFVITFADPAGLKARFLDRLDDEQALAAAEIIFELSPEAYECGPEEIAQRIANREQFKLWWD